MELLLKPHTATPLSTISYLYIDGVFQCYILEDTDRGLRSEMTLTTLYKIKIRGATAIPTGRYKVVISYSNRFRRYLPLLVDVPAFEGIRIHPGNVPSDTDGCLLPGTQIGKSDDMVMASLKAFQILMLRLTSVEKKEEIWITVTRK